MTTEIMCDNVLEAATVTSEATIAGFPAANMVAAGTARQAGFAAGATRQVVFDLGGTVYWNGFGIAKHNIFSAGGRIRVEYSSNGTSWFTRFLLTPTSDGVIFHNPSSTTYRYIRLSIENHTQDIYIGNLVMGSRLDVEDGMRPGFSPLEWDESGEITGNVTRGGDLAGLTYRQKPKTGRLDFKTLTETWVLTNWPTIKGRLRQAPFYLRWGASKPPAYCWLRKELKSPVYLDNGRLSLTLDVEGVV